MEVYMKKIISTIKKSIMLIAEPVSVDEMKLKADMLK